MRTPYKAWVLKYLILRIISKLIRSKSIESYRIPLQVHIHITSAIHNLKRFDIRFFNDKGPHYTFIKIKIYALKREISEYRRALCQRGICLP